MDNILGIAMSLCFPKQINVGFHSYIASQIGFHFLKVPEDIAHN